MTGWARIPVRALQAASAINPKVSHLIAELLPQVIITQIAFNRIIEDTDINDGRAGRRIEPRRSWRTAVVFLF